MGTRGMARPKTEHFVDDAPFDPYSREAMSAEQYDEERCADREVAPGRAPQIPISES